ncbi:MAG: trigger factor [Candidatus Azobacteroides sp.]|nr:trigger factor [Candidatus Azobacteroides sp.]
MNITLKNIDPVNAIIKIDIAQADYAEETEKALKNLRQNASIPGFRKGMVPMGYIKKMYEKSAIAEQVNKVVSQGLYDYIRENELNILGEPLPDETEQKNIDFNTDVDFEFYFDIALVPQIEVKLTKRDKLPYYTIEISEDMLDKQIENFKANYGTYEQADQIEGKDLAKGLLIELDEKGKVKEEGLELPDSILMSSFMKDEEEKAKFVEAKLNSVIIFNPYKAYEGAHAELTSLLRIPKNMVEDYKETNFSFEIKEITRYVEAELNQDLFDKVFEEEGVKTEEEFKAKVKEMLSTQTKPDSDYKFLLDIRQLLDKKTENITFPETFLKRWLLVNDEKYTPEAMEQDFPKIIEELRFHLTKKQIFKDNGFKAEEEDLNNAAKAIVKAQFAQYGIANIPDDLLENYAKDLLKKEETIRNLVNKVLENQLVEWMKKTITLQNKEVTVDEFRKFFE